MKSVPIFLIYFKYLITVWVHEIVSRKTVLSVACTQGTTSDNNFTVRKPLKDALYSGLSTHIKTSNKYADAGWNRGKEEPLLAGPLRTARTKAEHNSPLFPGHSWRGSSLSSTARREGSGRPYLHQNAHGGAREAQADLREGGDADPRAEQEVRQEEQISAGEKLISLNLPPQPTERGTSALLNKKRGKKHRHEMPYGTHPLKPCHFPARTRQQHLTRAIRLCSLHLFGCISPSKSICSPALLPVPAVTQKGWWAPTLKPQKSPKRCC